MHVLIITNGILEDMSLWQEEIGRAGLIIAADGGARHARALGLVPHVLVGDADSLDTETARWLKERGAAHVRYPSAKDETDLELALLHAVEAGATEIAVVGALGRRPDHTLANLHLLAHPRLAGRRVRLLGADYEVMLLRGGEEVTLTGAEGQSVSLLPMAGDARGICTAGLRWALDHATLSFGPARGVSNQMTAPQACVRLQEGLLLVVHLFDRNPPAGNR